MMAIAIELKPKSWTDSDWEDFSYRAEQFSILFSKLKTYPFEYAPGDLVTINNNAETLRGRCGVIVEFSSVHFMPYVVRILGTRLHQMYGGFELDRDEFGTRPYYDTGILWCDHCCVQERCEGRPIQLDNVESIEQPEDVDRSLRFTEYWKVAVKYYQLLKSADGVDSEEKDRIKNELDALSVPFSDDIGFHAFLEIERIAAGLSDK